MTFNSSGQIQFYLGQGVWNRIAIKPNSQQFIATNRNNYYIISDWSGNLVNYTYSAGISDCDYSPDGKYYAIGTFKSQTYVYDADNYSVVGYFNRGNGPIPFGTTFGNQSGY